MLYQWHTHSHANWVALSTVRVSAIADGDWRHTWRLILWWSYYDAKLQCGHHIQLASTSIFLRQDQEPDVIHESKHGDESWVWVTRLMITKRSSPMALWNWLPVATEKVNILRRRLYQHNYLDSNTSLLSRSIDFPLLLVYCLLILIKITTYWDGEERYRSEAAQRYLLFTKPNYANTSTCKRIQGCTNSSFRLSRWSEKPRYCYVS